MDIDTSPLKRCSSAPVIPNAAARTSSNSSASASHSPDPAISPPTCTGAMSCDTPPAPNIFSRTRRYSSGSFSPLAGTASSASSSSAAASNNPHIHLVGSPSPATATAGPRLTPRVSQLRKEECADNLNTREVSHERGMHNQLQISQSWEDLTIVTESWSCRDDLSSHANSLPHCSSPSPTSSRHPQLAAQQQQQPPASYGAIRYPFGMSPSPTRKAFATRRSMSPNHVRPSQLCPVKRKFDMEDSCGGGSPPPHKKMFLDVVARGTSPIHSLSLCSSPDSGTYEGRTTPKLFISKLCSSNSLSSFSSASASPTSQLEGMNEGGGPAVSGTGAGDKGLHNSNTPSTASEDTEGGGGGEGTVGETRGGEEEADEAKERGGDHPMLDVSLRECGNCDRTGGGLREAVDGNDKKKVGVTESGVEVDDGIGEEMLPCSKKVNGEESESVPVI